MNEHVKVLKEDGIAGIVIGLIVLVCMASAGEFSFTLCGTAVALIFMGVRDLSLAWDMDDGTYFG